MKTTSKQQIAMSVVVCILLIAPFWQPDPNSPTMLVAVLVFLVAVYFTFRYNNQIKRQTELGVIPEPSIEAKRRHFWALTAGLTLGALTGSLTIIFNLQQTIGLFYSLLALIPFDLFIAYLIYWLWRKFYRVQ